jgi:hypothetical protein
MCKESFKVVHSPIQTPPHVVFAAIGGNLHLARKPGPTTGQISSRG